MVLLSQLLSPLLVYLSKDKLLISQSSHHLGINLFQLLELFCLINDLYFCFFI